MPPKTPTPDFVEQLHFMQASLDHLSDLVVVTDTSLEGKGPRIVYVNQAVVDRTGYSREQLLGRSPRIFQGPETDTQARRRIAQALSNAESVTEELVNYTREGEPYWVEIQIRPLRDAEGQHTHFVSTQRDITERKRIEADLNLFRQAIDQSPSSVIITNRVGEITYVNSGFQNNTGYSADEVIGRRPGFRAWSAKSQEEKRAFWTVLERGEAWRGEFVNRHKDGRRVVKRAVVSPVRNTSGEVSHYLSVEQDVTAEKEALARLEHLAYHDPLSGLPNRRRFEENVKACIDGESCEEFALVLFGLDEFNRINDAYGHDFGDRLLHQIGKRLSARLTPGRELLAHIGWEEFGLLLHVGDACREEVRARLQNFCVELGKVVRTVGGSFVLTASAGVVRLGVDGRSFEDLRRHADLALCRARETGGGRIEYYQAELGEQALRRVELEAALRNAVLRDELSLAVQSQYSPDGAVMGAEVLVRWLNGPEGKPVSPGEFIPVAESSGLIKPLTLQVLSKALDILAQMGRAGHGVPLSVNFSSILLHDAAFIGGVIELIGDSDVSPDLLMIEITESLFIDNHADLLENIARLSFFGIRFSLDDFGTGYSNLAYLKKLHLSELKIDKRFVDHLPEDEGDCAIVRSILSIARQLGLRVVAEGVELQAQADFLAQHGCDLLQGYLLHKPEPAEHWLSGFMAGVNEKNEKGG